ncbi:hypothetical protein [Actinoallomurus sp. CA-142502]|uniref:hypothetical protein n=1 Tax=Actinoallomurus sp. CA-142502 TaxID=3239885 RepID=UPI003D8A86B1
MNGGKALSGKRAKLCIAATTLAGSALTAGTANAAAPAGPVAAPAYSCTYDSLTHVNGADWLLVHTSPSTSAPRVGELPYGAQVKFCSSSYTSGSGYVFVYGYGYNGSTKVTGWMVTAYLAFP